MQSGLHHRAASDAVALASAELVMRQPGIVPLHAVNHYQCAELLDGQRS